MATLDSDDLRALTGYKAVTWVDTSGNAKTTIEAASAGTLVRLGPGTHALGANVVNVPDGVSVTGCGMGVTTITSTTDSLEDETGAIFCPGSNGYYADFTVAATSFDNTKFQVPFGWFVFQSASTNILVERVETYALVDGFYFDEGSSIVHMRDCVARSNWDALVITSGVEVFSERLRLYCIGPNTIGSQQTRAVNLDGSAIWHDRNSELVTWSTAGGAADSSIGVQVGNDNFTGRADLFGTVISSRKTSSIGGAAKDLYSPSSSVTSGVTLCNVDTDPIRWTNVTPRVVPSMSAYDVRKIVQSIRG
jgi:hypothetical protein